MQIEDLFERALVVVLDQQGFALGALTLTLATLRRERRCRRTGSRRNELLARLRTRLRSGRKLHSLDLNGNFAEQPEESFSEPIEIVVASELVLLFD